MRPDVFLGYFAAQENINKMDQSKMDVERTDGKDSVTLNLDYIERLPPAGNRQADADVHGNSEPLKTEYFPFAWILPKPGTVFEDLTRGRAALACKRQLECVTMKGSSPTLDVWMIPLKTKLVHPEQHNAIAKLQQHYREANEQGEALRCQRSSAAHLAREDWPGANGRHSQDCDDENRLMTAAELYHGGKTLRELQDQCWDFESQSDSQWSDQGSHQ